MNNGKPKWIQIPSTKTIKWHEGLSKDAAVAILFNDRNQFEKLFYQCGQVLTIFYAKDGMLDSNESYPVHIHALAFKRWGFILERQFHVIGSDGYYYHLQWNDEESKFKKLHDLGKYGDIIINNVIKTSTDKLWIICNDKERNFVIKEYSNDKDLWVNKITLTQCMIQKELGRGLLCCISVYNETFLIIFGSVWNSKTIYVIDVNKKTIGISALELPSLGSQIHATSTRNKTQDEMLVHGYCKEISKEYSHICIPYYVVDFVAHWMVMEFIQIICGQGGNIDRVWGVNVDDILETVIPRRKGIKRGRRPDPSHGRICSECGQQFTRPQSVLRHQGKVKGSFINCPVLMQKFNTE